MALVTMIVFHTKIETTNELLLWLIVGSFA
jgi:hypothetical protein